MTGSGGVGGGVQGEGGRREPNPGNSPIIHCSLALETKKKHATEAQKKNVLLHANINNIPLTRGIQDLRKKVFLIVTDKQTDMATL